MARFLSRCIFYVVFLSAERGDVTASLQAPCPSPAREVGKKGRNKKKWKVCARERKEETRAKKKQFCFFLSFFFSSASLLFSRAFFRMRGLRAAVEAALLSIASSPSSLNRIRNGGGGTGNRGELIRRWSHRRRDMSSSELTPLRPPPKASRAEVATSRVFLDTARVLITEDGRPRVVGR